ncbi:MAG: hypothetical protein RIC35_15190 [Marinoscillum sp.]
MKLIIRIFLIIIVAYFLSFYLPWWSLIVLTFIIGFLIPGHGLNLFISGFLGGGLLWMAYSWYLDTKTQSILTDKIIHLFPFEDGFLLIILSGLIGGLSAGFGCLSGNSFRHLFMKKKTKSFYS